LHAPEAAVEAGRDEGAWAELKSGSVRPERANFDGGNGSADNIRASGLYRRHDRTDDQRNAEISR
jgi:hypothetical protein